VDSAGRTGLSDETLEAVSATSSGSGTSTWARGWDSPLRLGGRRDCGTWRLPTFAVDDGDWVWQDDRGRHTDRVAADSLYEALYEVLRGHVPPPGRGVRARRGERSGRGVLRRERHYGR